MPILNQEKQAAPCGTWLSSLTADAVSGSKVGLGGLSVDGEVIYWLESRPSEEGRVALVCRQSDGVIKEATPAPFSVRSHVHEYGGGAYIVDKARIIFSESSTNAIWMIEGDSAPRLIAEVPGCRYADFRFMPNSNSFVCVREDHRDEKRAKQNNAEATIVLFDLSKDKSPELNEGVVIATGLDFYSSPRPSPDGKKLAYIGWNHPNMPWDSTFLYVTPIKDNGEIPTASLIAGGGQCEAIVQPEWSSEGVLYFCSDRTNWWNIYRVHSENNFIEPVTTIEGEIGGPHWVFGDRYFNFLPSGDIIALLVQNGLSYAIQINPGTLGNYKTLSFSTHSCPLPISFNESSGRIGFAYISATTDAPSSICLLMDSFKNAPIEIRTSEPKFLATEEISVGKPISFSMGIEKQAYAIYYQPMNAQFKPVDYEKPPLVVMCHGGPTDLISNAFNTKIQFWTNRGFAVVDVNYPGSTGFGRLFRDELKGGWGVKDVEACNHVVKHLVNTGLADPNRVTIRGGSAGGYTVLAALTSGSGVFKAGASYYGIGNLEALASDTHKFESRYLDSLIGRWPEDAAIYSERAPINHLDRLTGAIILFQGLEDKVVPPSQAKEIAKSMRIRGLPVELYEFQGEGHGFRKRETQVTSLNLELAFYAKIFGFSSSLARIPVSPLRFFRESTQQEEQVREGRENQVTP